jgi:hypothetical protein
MMRSISCARTLTLAAGRLAGTSICAAVENVAANADAIYLNGKVLTVDANNRTKR